MTPAFSQIDSDKVALGNLADYSITSAAIPVDVADTSGAITSFTTKHTLDPTDTTSGYYAIGQKLSLTPEDGGLYEGKVTSVGSPVRGSMSLTADTLMGDLSVDKRVYPIYQSRGIPKHLAAAALDHWTQTVGIFYDRVPGKVITYHSFYGHDYMHSNSPANRPRLRNLRLGAVPYKYSTDRVMLDIVPGEINTLLSATVQDANSLISPTDNLPVPSAASGAQLVFSTGFDVAGSGHTGSMTWYMASARADQAGARAIQMMLNWSNTAGFSLYLNHPPAAQSTTVFTPSGALQAGRYRVLIGVQATEGSTTQSTFTMRIIREATGEYTTRTATVTTPMRGTQVQLNYVDQTAGTVGTGTNWGMYGYFVSIVPSSEMPTATLPTTKVLAATSRDIALVPGFSGDVWAMTKAFLALHRLDLWYENGKLRTGLRETAARNIPSLSSLTPTLTQRESAKYVEVVNQNMQALSAVPKVLFAADSVYQVSTGEVQTFTVQTEHSIDTVNSPACVSGITPYPYKEGIGQYVITGSDGYIVSPAWWETNGGRVNVRTTEREGEIEVTIKGPDYDSPRAPYRVSEGDAGRPALYITGTGVVGEPETLKVPTGNSKAVKDIGETIDIPFITDRELAYRAAVQAALRFASPELKLSGKEAKSPGRASALGTRGAGALVEYDGNTYRISSLTQNTRANSFNEAVQYNLLRHRVEAFPGRTIRQANAANGGKTIKDRALKPLVRA